MKFRGICKIISCPLNTFFPSLSGAACYGHIKSEKNQWSDRLAATCVGLGIKTWESFKKQLPLWRWTSYVIYFRSRVCNRLSKVAMQTQFLIVCRWAQINFFCDTQICLWRFIFIMETTTYFLNVRHGELKDCIWLSWQGNKVMLNRAFPNIRCIIKCCEFYDCFFIFLSWHEQIPLNLK